MTIPAHVLTVVVQHQGQTEVQYHAHAMMSERISVPTIPRFRAFGQGKSATMAVQRLTLPLQMPPITRNKRNMLKLRETVQTA